MAGRNEFESPPNTKVRLVVTVDQKVCEQLRIIHQREIEDAEKRDRVEPDWSNTVEMVLRKGIKAYNVSK